MEIHPWSIEVQQALPGSGSTDMATWHQAAPGRMLRLFRLPDQGPVTEACFAPAHPAGSNHPAQTASDHPANNGPASPPPEPPPSPGSGPAGISVLPEEPVFGDWQPKTSPDTLLDYRPALADQVAGLPLSLPDQLPALLATFCRLSLAASREPGRWEAGNPVLGGRPREYRPSDAELLLAETGRRIRQAAARAKARNLPDPLPDCTGLPCPPDYLEFRFGHLDVMGSGRFFYAEVLGRQSLVP